MEPEAAFAPRLAQSIEQRAAQAFAFSRTPRVISGLQRVELAESPWPRARARSGAQAQGLRFERRVAQALGAARHGQWFRFEDNNGPGFCSPDLLFAVGDTLWIGECKLTDWPSADAQLELLYAPVLRPLWPGPIAPLVLVKYLSPLLPRGRVVETLGGALSGGARWPAPILWVHSKRELAPQPHKIRAPELLSACTLGA